MIKGIRDGTIKKPMWDWLNSKVDTKDMFVWEPFANNDVWYTPEYIKCQKLLAYSMKPKDSRVIYTNSLKTLPGGVVDLIIFHPPHFGAAAFSDDPDDLSNESNFLEWHRKISNMTTRLLSILAINGYVFLVGGSYLYKGQNIDMFKILSEIFKENGFIDNCGAILTPDKCGLFSTMENEMVFEDLDRMGSEDKFLPPPKRIARWEVLNIERPK